MTHAPETTIVFAGGGSGGHISPGLAIAEQLAALDDSARALFICSERPIDAHMLDRAGAEYAPIPAAPPSIRPVGAWRFIRRFLASRRSCKSLMAERNVRCVLAMGGFVSAPVVSAAKALGIKVILVNLDDPPGKANRWIAKRADVVLTAIVTAGLPKPAEAVTGVPVRSAALAPAEPSICRQRLGLESDRLTLLVTGASQGATSVNQFITAWCAQHAERLDAWQVLHLAGREHAESVRKAYETARIQAVVLEFLDDMGLAWGAADLAISRAGANSVAEVALNAVPTLFLPYPYHKDMHQRRNAEPLEAIDGAVIATDRIEVSANIEHVGPLLSDLLNDADRRAAMRANLVKHRPPNAAEVIARRALGLAER
jgi:UDP-N-acetylglucosamine--N-acetylmuramyl-(pentapeptide) pyrophosphoryl-undecaprenol N-acetylglucosamine transferase